MADDERLSLRNLPAVEPVEPPLRFSQTLLGHLDRCKRAGYLYQKHSGGTPGHQLDFGTFFHLCAEEALRRMVAAGGSFDAEGDREPVRLELDVGKQIVDEVGAAHPELTLPGRARDKVREMMYHLSVGYAIDPGKVAGIEQKFVLELGGQVVSGKVDVALIAGDVAEVDDWKTTFNVPAQDEFEDGFQTTIVYPILLLWGNPVEKAPDGSERLLPPIGESVQWVRARELYPRYLRKDGDIQYREAILSRGALADLKVDLEASVREAAERFGMADGGRDVAWRFPAVSGHHCSMCPARGECPLPPPLRSYVEDGVLVSHAGEINDMAAAAEAAEWSDFMGDQVAATRKELKRFHNIHGPIYYGRNWVREIVPTPKREVDVDGLVLAASRAAVYGEPFDVEDFVKCGEAMNFKRRRLSPEERREVAAEEPEFPLEERFGVDAPF